MIVGASPDRFALRTLLLLTLWGATIAPAAAQHSAAREWNEALLEAIRNDFARPTVHARNLFHVSAAMYDAWAAYDEVAEPYLLGRMLGEAVCDFDGVPAPNDVEAARTEALSYAAYRLLRHRFLNSPGSLDTLPLFDALLAAQGYDPAVLTTDYATGEPAALGNYVAQCYIDYGLQDGANELGGYENTDYEPVNPPLTPIEPGNPDLEDPDRWQPLRFKIFIDQSGNEIPGGTPAFVSPEWGRVRPFALREADRVVYERDGHPYPVYHDPGPPPLLGTDAADDYLWGFTLVMVWSSHLDPSDGVTMDISPASLGNFPALPESLDEYPDFYDLVEGGDPSMGHDVNPRTGFPYEPQIVPRGDYARVLAEFWADGPDSETPPGHWFTLLNYVNDHPLLEKRFGGTGPVLDDLEWDVKAYFALGGAMHDAAVTAWGLKGWYDYIRPISALRAMADRGQGSDPDGPQYDPTGIPLLPDTIELVETGDPLEGEAGEHLGKVKVRAWRGPDVIEDPEVDEAGVGWILAENWWPYQRPTFITPPFAGYVSGHSTFSRAAAEVLTLLTGDAYFPGGLGEFVAPQNEFLVFEEGPSVDVTLQWATYRDAADQCSLSRIWGGIHPPGDDIPGRHLGARIGPDAFAYAARYFSGTATDVEPAVVSERPALSLYPNPIASGDDLVVEGGAAGGEAVVFDVRGRRVHTVRLDALGRARIETRGLAAGGYIVRLTDGASAQSALFHVISHRP
jgi:hypothetical protein